MSRHHEDAPWIDETPFTDMDATIHATRLLNLLRDNIGSAGPRSTSPPHRGRLNRRLRELLLRADQVLE